MTTFKSYFTRQIRQPMSGQFKSEYERPKTLHKRQKVLQSVLSEFYSSAKLTAVFTSLVNAEMRGIRLQNVSRPLAYVPPTPLILPAVAAGLTPLNGHADLIANLQEYYERIGFARGISDFDGAPSNQVSESHRRELAQIGDVWQRICSIANVVAHQCFDVEESENPVRRQMLISTHQLIKAAHAGQHPCVRADGTMFIPGWLDQRREERRPAVIPVRLEFSGKIETAMLQNISSGGMGIASRVEIAVGEQISVQLPNFRLLVGIVAWCSQGRIGARFLTPLSQTDPLLTTPYMSGLQSCVLN
jgi:PilZ domain